MAERINLIERPDFEGPFQFEAKGTGGSATLSEEVVHVGSRSLLAKSAGTSKYAGADEGWYTHPTAKELEGGRQVTFSFYVKVKAGSPLIGKRIGGNLGQRAEDNTFLGNEGYESPVLVEGVNRVSHTWVLPETCWGFALSTTTLEELEAEWWVGSMLLEYAGEVLPYFDGGVSPEEEGWEVSWLGEAHNSRSAAKEVLGEAPTATTKPAEEITETSATLKGSLTIGGLDTDWWFEWGTTEALGEESPVHYTLSGENAAYERGARPGIMNGGLEPGTTYFFRLAAENELGTAHGAILSFTTEAERPWKRRHVEHKPPLELDLEAEDAEGGISHFPSDSRIARRRPFGLTCGSERGEGFSTGTAAFQRDILRDYGDLNLLDTWRMVGREGSVAYEGRLGSFPRSNDPQTINLNLLGWMTYLKGRPVPMLIIDRRLGGWADPSTARKLSMLGEGFYRYEGALSSGWQSTGATGPAVLLTFSTFDGTFDELGEAWLYAGGEDIGSVRFDFKRLEGGVVDTGWHCHAYLCSDDLASSFDASGEFHVADVVDGYADATVAGRKWALLQAYYTNNAAAGHVPNTLAFLHPRIVGTHGLTEKGSRPEEGYAWSDIVEHMLATYFPKVTLAGERNELVVQQCTGHDRKIDGFQTLQELNNLTLWETNMWEGRKLHTEPADLTKFDWWIDTTDPGTTVNLQGDSIENFANGIVVDYEDFWGRKFTLWPDDHVELRDQGENNPATLHGEPLYTSKTVPWPCTEGEALQFGRAQLIEYNRPKRPGSFTVRGGYIRDGAGHWQQGWKVRNSQTLGIKNHPFETEPRLIHAPRWNQETLTLTLAVDAPPQTLDAIVARRNLAAEARGL